MTFLSPCAIVSPSSNPVTRTGVIPRARRLDFRLLPLACVGDVLSSGVRAFIHALSLLALALGFGRVPRCLRLRGFLRPIVLEVVQRSTISAYVFAIPAANVSATLQSSKQKLEHRSRVIFYPRSFSNRKSAILVIQVFPGPSHLR